MRAHQIMTRHLITVAPETPLREAAEKMLAHRFSALPVVDDKGRLLGLVSEGDLMHRAETATQRKPSPWLWLFLNQHAAAKRYVVEHGRAVSDVMTCDVITVAEDAPLDKIVELMERKRVKRLPVVKDGKLVGMISRADIVHAFVDNSRDVADPTADDKHIQERVYRALRDVDWRPIGLQVSVRKGEVHLRGVIVEEAARRASVVAAENVAGVERVYDHLMFVDGWSGIYVPSPEDLKAAG